MKAMHPEREAWAQALARALETERTTRTQDIELERAACESEVARESQARADSHAELAVAIGRANINCEERCNEIEKKLGLVTKEAVPTGSPPAQEMPLRITLVGAKGLRDADWMPGTGTSDPYCVCELLGKPDAPRVETQVIKNTCDPVWNHEAELPVYTPGDTLVFKVYDQVFGKADDFLGSLTLPS